MTVWLDEASLPCGSEGPDGLEEFMSRPSRALQAQPASTIIPCSARSCGWRCVAPRYSVTHRVCLSRRVTEFG
jgi:hypothetical protein